MNLGNLLLSIVIGIVVWRWWRKHRVKRKRWWQKKEESAPRHWQPKSEKACPGCQAGQPYRSQKRKAGKPKQLSTEGYACPCLDCAYFGVTGEAVQALVGYGKIGKNKTIQCWRCQACRTTLSCRRGTLLYYLKSDRA